MSIKGTRRDGTLGIVALVLACAGCEASADGDDGDETPQAGPWDAGIVVPAEPQTAGDAAAGYHALLHAPYVSCGIPYTLFSLTSGAFGPVTDTAPLPDRDGRNAEVPYHWTVSTTAEGVELTTQNCLLCHAGRFNGQLVIGLGNADADFTVDQGDFVDNAPDVGGFLDDAELAEFEKWRARISVLGPQTVMRTVGTNPAEMLAVTLAAHRDRDTLAWSPEPLEEIPQVVVPSDPPPWWHMAKKNAMFYNAMGRGEHRRIMMQASSLCTDSVEEAETIDAYFNDIRAFIVSLQAPPYPFAIDTALADTGRPIFEQNCAGCHGTYGEEESYPNLLIPIGVVGTDPVVALGGTSEAFGEALVQWYNASWYGTAARMEPFAGYIAPPLDGVWATGPFLHNGSVPTIEGVLNSEKRPRYWKRVDFDSRNFDEDALGWPYVELDAGHDQADPGERKFIYDTSQLAHANTGHPFGDHLDDPQRRAVLEYLKTL
jgi:mono/diheme cytochrome c family protein